MSSERSLSSANAQLRLRGVQIAGGAGRGASCPGRPEDVYRVRCGRGSSATDEIQPCHMDGGYDREIRSGKVFNFEGGYGD